MCVFERERDVLGNGDEVHMFIQVCMHMYMSMLVEARVSFPLSAKVS